MEEIDHAVKVATSFRSLTFEEKKAYRFGELKPELFCRECGLCMPCPEGVEITIILRWDFYYTFYSIMKWTRAQYPKLKTRVNSCTECGKCAEKCPVRVPSEFEEKLGQRKAIYIPFPQAVPAGAVIDACMQMTFLKRDSVFSHRLETEERLN